MQYRNSENSKYIVSVSKDELSIFCRSISTVCRCISERGFQSRMGYYFDEVNHLLKYLQREITNSPTEVEDVEIRISKDDFYIIWQSFNEVCNGLKIDSYDDLIGVGRADLLDIFGQWRTFKDKIQ
jgi:hypothetical protein